MVRIASHSQLRSHKVSRATLPTMKMNDEE